MQDFVIDEAHDANSRQPEESFFASHVFASGTEALKRIITKNPGRALLISASIGVLLACLSKRR